MRRDGYVTATSCSRLVPPASRSLGSSSFCAWGDTAGGHEAARKRAVNSRTEMLSIIHEVGEERGGLDCFLSLPTVYTVNHTDHLDAPTLWHITCLRQLHKIWKNNNTDHQTITDCLTYLLQIMHVGWCRRRDSFYWACWTTQPLHINTRTAMEACHSGSSMMHVCVWWSGYEGYPHPSSPSLPPHPRGSPWEIKALWSVLTRWCWGERVQQGYEQASEQSGLEHQTHDSYLKAGEGEDVDASDCDHRRVPRGEGRVVVWDEEGRSSMQAGVRGWRAEGSRGRLTEGRMLVRAGRRWPSIPHTGAKPLRMRTASADEPSSFLTFHTFSCFRTSGVKGHWSRFRYLRVAAAGQKHPSFLLGFHRTH